MGWDIYQYAVNAEMQEEVAWVKATCGGVSLINGGNELGI